MERGIELLKHFESCRLEAYQDGGGVWTIGWGTTAMAGLGIVPCKGMVITQEEADILLELGVSKFLGTIIPMITRQIPGHQLGAYLSLAYNIGTTAFKNSTTLRRFNAGDEQGAAEAILWWNKDNGKVIRGLVRRREAERHLFLTGEVVT